LIYKNNIININESQVLITLKSNERATVFVFKQCREAILPHDLHCPSVLIKGQF